MHERLALRLLRNIMKWSEEVATQEYDWLRLIARLKYDGYRDYIAGVRFAESLAWWLQQFAQEDRQVAYNFVKDRLVYFSPPEVQRLVEQFYPRFVEPELRKAAAVPGVPSYMVWSNEQTNFGFQCRRRQSLFIGLSDGARIDLLRRANTGILANDQIVLATHIDDEKWEDLGKKLAEDRLLKGLKNPQFDSVYLIDDFTASGTTFVRQKDGAWVGKAKKFWDAIQRARESLKKAGKELPLADSFSLTVHHYISTAEARKTIISRLDEIKHARAVGDWFAHTEVTEGLLLPETIKLTEPADSAVLALCERYYDKDLFEQLKEHLAASGQDHVKLGYGHCALPVILEHNCPNNTLPIVWDADSPLTCEAD